MRPTGSLIAADPTRRHVQQLIDNGAAMVAIARAVGCSHTTICNIRGGKTQTISSRLAAAIAKLEPAQVARQGHAGRPIGTIAETRIAPPGPWVGHAACATHPLDLWFPTSRNTGRAGGPDSNYLQAVARAKALCARCPVLDDCRAHGITHEPHGIWGGLTETEREQLRRKGAA